MSLIEIYTDYNMWIAALSGYGFETGRNSTAITESISLKFQLIAFPICMLYFCFMALQLARPQTKLQKKIYTQRLRPIAYIMLSLLIMRCMAPEVWSQNLITIYAAHNLITGSYIAWLCLGKTPQDLTNEEKNYLALVAILLFVLLSVVAMGSITPWIVCLGFIALKSETTTKELKTA